MLGDETEIVDNYSWFRSISFLEALRDIDYSGYLSLEVFDFSPGSEAIAEDAMAFMTAQLKPLLAPRT